MKVVVTGPIHRQGGITTNTALLATYMAFQHNMFTLVMDGQFTYGTLQEIIWPNAEDNISEVFTLAKSKTLRTENLVIHTNCVVEKKLRLLGATRQKFVNENMKECLPVILDTAKSCFDMTFIDTNAGLKNEVTLAALEVADIIIVCLPQDDLVLQDMFIKKDPRFWNPVYENKNTIYVVGKYKDSYQHYNWRKIKRKYKLKDLYVIPDSDMINKSIYEQRLLSWVEGNFDDDSDVFPYLRKIAERILRVEDKKGIGELISKLSLRR